MTKLSQSAFDSATILLDSGLVTEEQDIVLQELTSLFIKFSKMMGHEHFLSCLPIEKQKITKAGESVVIDP
jgi:hypothetical protein